MTDAPLPDGAVFDFDGVIVDSRAPVRTAVNEALAAHGFARRNPAELDRFIGPPVLAAFAELTGEREDSDAVGACAATYHLEYERVYLTQTTIVDGIVAVLDAVEIPLALATAKAGRVHDAAARGARTRVALQDGLRCGALRAARAQGGDRRACAVQTRC